jgi:hypothetical protein
MNETNMPVVAVICGIGIIVIMVIGILTIASPKFREWLNDLYNKR